MTRLITWLNLVRLGFVMIFLVLLTTMYLSDPDYFWHLRTGQYLFEHHALPIGDIFSYTFDGKPWVLHEWLFEIVLYCTHTLLGSFGVKLVVSLMVVTTLVIIYKTANQIIGRSSVAFALILLFFIPMLGAVSPRPQLVTLLMFAFFMHALIAFKYANTTRTLWLLPPLMVVWANAHGGYIIGIALLLMFVGCEWLIRIARSHHGVVGKSRLKVLSWVVGVTILASLVNPYFIRHWLYPFEVMGMKAAQEYITEWHSPNFHSWQSQLYLALVLFTMIAAMYRKVRPDLTELAVTLFFVVAGFVAVRHTSFAMIALVPFAATTITQLSLTRLLADERVRRMHSNYQRFAHNGKDIGKMEFVLNWILLTMTVAGLALYYPVRHGKDAEIINKTVPVKATEFIVRAGINGRMFNTYHYGGYLIQALHPTQKVFIDGRADVYGDKFMQEYMAISQGEAGWKEKFEKYGIDYVVMQRDTPLIQILKAQGNFSLVFEDEINSVLLRDDERFTKIIATYNKATPSN